MKNIILGIILGVILGGAAVWIYHQHAGPEGKEEKKEEKKEVSYLRHGTNGETFLQIDKEAQARMGLKTAALSPAQLQPEVQGFGRVLDPSPLSGLIIESASAKAALNASTKEYERLKLLHGENQNVSTRALEAAE